MLKKNKAEKFSELAIPEYIRAKTGMGELDRVLGGGIVQGSLILVGGENVWEEMAANDRKTLRYTLLKTFILRDNKKWN